MTESDLDLVVRSTGDLRYRSWTDPSSREYRPGMVRFVERKAGLLRGAPEPELPALGDQIRSALTAIGQTLRAAVADRPLHASPGLQAARLAACQGGVGLAADQVIAGHCDQYRPSDGRCAACGCHLTGMVSKVALAAADCPLGRWPAADPIA